MKQKFLICHHCGNIAALIRDNGVPIICCGEEMEELIPGTTEASEEKHIPVYEVGGNTVRVTVGQAEHPMTEEHYIPWVALETEKSASVEWLQPGQAPEVVFALAEGQKAKAVYAWCNLHGLWKQEL